MDISLNGLWTNDNNFIRTKIIESLTPIQKKVVIIAISIFALAAVGYLIYRIVAKNNKYPSLNSSWINDQPNRSLWGLGFDDYDKLKNYINEHGTELKCLNLIGHKINKAQFEQLIKSCPNLTHLFVESSIIEDKALEHLKGMPLTSVTLAGCYKLTDKALEHLKGMPLTSFDFSNCGYLTE